MSSEGALTTVGEGSWDRLVEGEGITFNFFLFKKLVELPLLPSIIFDFPKLPGH